MTVISRAKTFVVVGRGSSNLFVHIIQNQECAASRGRYPGRMRTENQRSQKWSIFNAVFHDGRFHKEEPKRASKENITLKGFNIMNQLLRP